MNFDIDFSVPFRHRVRFTTDLANEEFQTLLELIEPSGDQAKLLVIADSALLAVPNQSNPSGDNESSNDSRSWLNTVLDQLDAAPQIKLLDCNGFNPPLSSGTNENNNDQRTGNNCRALLMSGGEDCKNDTSQIERVLALINHFDIDRRNYVLVIGGGAVLDAVGYAAAIAHRGVRLIRLPTTTLAQDDSGVGVKNAINYFNKKNWVGTFAVPWGVVNDAKILKSLSDRDFRCGFSEAVKVSLLKSVDDFDFLCRNATEIYERQMEVAFEAVKRSCVWHLKHITQGGDPFEALEARPLDFGHWSAHKMESLTDYRIRHGEAVGIGVAIDALYSRRMFGFPEQDANRVLKCLGDLGLALWDPILENKSDLLNGLEEFRQHLGGRLTVTMLRRVGEPIDVHEIDSLEMHAAIDDLKKWHIARLNVANVR
ncbi:MAG: 3-dehydroquinate synthase [Planctomycetota bacterium]